MEALIINFFFIKLLPPKGSLSTIKSLVLTFDKIILAPTIYKNNEDKVFYINKLREVIYKR